MAENLEVEMFTVLMRNGFIPPATFKDVEPDSMAQYISMYEKARKAGDWSMLFKLKETSGKIVFVAPIGQIQGFIQGVTIRA